MIKFTSLVTAIQGAIDQAVDMVSRENINALMDYFQPDPDSESSKDTPEGDSRDQALSAIQEMEPKVVRMKYPKLTPNGPVEHYVSVPLITLSPVPSLALSDVDVEMDLEVVEDNGEIMVGFPQAQSGKTGLLKPSKGGAAQPNAKIKINIKANDRAAGVTALVEGYNKMLRAQLPN